MILPCLTYQTGARLIHLISSRQSRILYFAWTGASEEVLFFFFLDMSMIGGSLRLEVAEAEKATCAVCCGESLEPIHYAETAHRRVRSSNHTTPTHARNTWCPSAALDPSPRLRIMQ